MERFYTTMSSRSPRNKLVSFSSTIAPSLLQDQVQHKLLAQLISAPITISIWLRKYIIRHTHSNHPESPSPTIPKQMDSLSNLIRRWRQCTENLQKMARTGTNYYRTSCLYTIRYPRAPQDSLQSSLVDKWGDHLRRIAKPKRGAQRVLSPMYWQWGIDWPRWLSWHNTTWAELNDSRNTGMTVLQKAENSSRGKTSWSYCQHPLTSFLPGAKVPNPVVCAVRGVNYEVDMYKTVATLSIPCEHVS